MCAQSILMETSGQIAPEEMVRLTIELPMSVVAWLDDLKTQMGFRSCGVIIGQLLLELSREASTVNEEPA